VEEEWRAVPGFEGLYEVSSLGHVRSLDRVVLCRRRHGPVWKRVSGKVMIGWPHSQRGYRMATLHRDGEPSAVTVHSLVAAAFLGPRPDGFDVAHYDGSPANNPADNLRYATRAENHADKKRHGTHISGEASHYAVLREQDVLAIRARPHERSDDLADEFGVTRTCVNHIRAGRTWRHV
jgi:hypothetical protein